jgi:hypothetical protein
MFQSPDQYGPLGPAQKIYIRYFSGLEVKQKVLKATTGRKHNRN